MHSHDRTSVQPQQSYVVVMSSLSHKEQPNAASGHNAEYINHFVNVMVDIRLQSVSHLNSVVFDHEIVRHVHSISSGQNQYIETSVLPIYLCDKYEINIFLMRMNEMNQAKKVTG